MTCEKTVVSSALVRTANNHLRRRSRPCGKLEARAKCFQNTSNAVKKSWKVWAVMWVGGGRWECCRGGAILPVPIETSLWDCSCASQIQQSEGSSH